MRAPWTTPPSSDAYKELISKEPKSAFPALIPGGPRSNLSGRMGHHWGAGTAPNNALRIYFLGMNDPKGANALQLLPHVQSIESSKQFATFFEWTFGGVPMHQTSGRKEEIFTLRGRGAPVAMGHGKMTLASTQPLPMTVGYLEKSKKSNGLEQFESLHEFLNYYDTAGKSTNMRMTLYMPWEGHAYHVEPQSFVWGSSTGDSKFGFTWELVVKAYSYDAPKKSLVFTPDTASQTALGAVMSVMANAAAIRNNLETGINAYGDYVSRWVSSIAGCVQIITSFTGIYTENELLKVPEKAVGLGRLVVNRATADLDKLAKSTPWVEKNSKFARSMRDIRAWSQETADTYTYAIAGMKRGSTSYKTLGKPLDDDEIKRWQEEVESPEGYFHEIPSVGHGEPGEGNEPGISPQNENQDGDDIPVTEYVVKEGDTLESISLLNLGDSANWVLLAALNGSTDGHGLWGNKPLTTGETILIPADVINLPVGTNTNSFLSDFLIGEDGDFVLAGTETNDVLLVNGKNCLQQDLQQALTTVKGQSLIFPDMGLTYEVGTPGTVSNISQIVFDVQETINKDPRIAAVTNTELIDGGDNLVINSVATAVNHETIAVIVPA